MVLWYCTPGRHDTPIADRTDHGSGDRYAGGGATAVRARAGAVTGRLSIHSLWTTMWTIGETPVVRSSTSAGGAQS